MKEFKVELPTGVAKIHSNYRYKEIKMAKPIIDDNVIRDGLDRLNRMTVPGNRLSIDLPVLGHVELRNPPVDTEAVMPVYYLTFVRDSPTSPWRYDG